MKCLEISSFICSFNRIDSGMITVMFKPEINPANNPTVVIK